MFKIGICVTKVGNEPFPLTREVASRPEAEGRNRPIEHFTRARQMVFYATSL